MTNESRIHGHAMLVGLNVTQWSARKVDKRAAAEVATTHNVASNKGTYYKSLVEGGALEEIKVIATKARAAHYRRTLPWSDAGPRILSNLGYLDYMAEIAALRDEFDVQVEKFVVEYPALREEAKRLLGSLFNEADYPSTAVVSAKFSMETVVMPIPRGEDFRCDIGDAEVEAIRQSIEQGTTRAVETCMTDAFNRVLKVTEALMDRLGTDDAVFRDSLITNARDLADILPSLNITSDPVLTDLTNQLVNNICVHEPEALRHNKTTRRQAYDAAMKMNAGLIDFFSGGAQ